MTEDISFSPQSAPRPNQVYVSWQLNKALGYAAKSEGCTKEDLFERVMNAYLFEKHPKIVAWVVERDEKEREFVKTLKP